MRRMSPPRTRRIRKLLRWPSPAHGPTSARPLPQPPFPRPACATSAPSTGCVASPSLVVVLFHFAPDVAPGGFLGVDLFFVLSGFLITSLLVTELQASHRISLGAFWARRARRLLPALFVVLGAVAHLRDRVRARPRRCPAVLRRRSSRRSSTSRTGASSRRARPTSSSSSRRPRARSGTPGPSRSRSSSTWCGRSWWCSWPRLWGGVGVSELQRTGAESTRCSWRCASPRCRVVLPHAHAVPVGEATSTASTTARIRARSSFSSAPRSARSARVRRPSRRTMRIPLVAVGSACAVALVGVVWLDRRQRRGSTRVGTASWRRSWSSCSSAAAQPGVNPLARSASAPSAGRPRPHLLRRVPLALAGRDCG